MRLRRCLVHIIMLVVLICSMGCGHYFGDNVVDESQSNMAVENYEVVELDSSASWSDLYRLMGMDATTDGIYYTAPTYVGENWCIMYYDIRTNTYDKWCSRADCNHTDASICAALFPDDMYQRWLNIYQGHMYQIRMTEDGAYLMRRNLDGSNLTQIVKLWSSNAAFNDPKSDNEVSGMYIHSGYLYYVMTEDYVNMAIMRTAIDGSAVGEKIYEWTQSPDEMTRRMKLDSESIYIYGLNHWSESFIVRHYPKTGENEELYRKNVDGVVTKDLSGGQNHDINSIEPFDGGMIYRTQNGLQFLYNCESKTVKEYKSNDASVIYTDNKGKYFVWDDYGSKVKVADIDANEVMTIDFQEYFEEGVTSVVIIGVDSRYIVFEISTGSSSGKYMIDYRDVEAGKVNLIKIGS